MTTTTEHIQVLENEIEHLNARIDGEIAATKAAEAEVARLRRERADLREKFWRALYDLPNPTEIMKRFDRAGEVEE